MTTYKIIGPAGRVIVKAATAARVHKILPALRKRFAPGNVKVKANPAPHRTALGWAISQLGVKEQPAGSNHTAYGMWYGTDRVPWCAIFASWCQWKADPHTSFRYAYVPAIVSDARMQRNGLRTVTPARVQPNDIVCYDWPGESPGVADHVGRFERWIVKGSTFTAIEGNTGVGNDSNGGEVMRRQRSVSDVQAFVRVDA